jgi:uncharacterized protein YyaL (SSP411 family)
MPNRLANETSPYLLQHANNPVDWQPWDEDALTQAQREDKPIFLSIGYAACHWCHVMEHESFEDPRIADILNRFFVNIKVDREERPDVDSIYMNAVVAMTGQGGWPMSLFLTPHGEPFYGGTYFPPRRSHGLPAFGEVIDSIARAWKDDRKQLTDVAGKLTQHLQEGSQWAAVKDISLSRDTLDQATAALLETYDWQNGGWGRAPKFPAPMAIEFLITQAVRGRADALPAVEHALESMNRGGMYDVVGGGFHRYSTDAVWRVPHFEKMLYDNAQLSLVYLHAYTLTGRIDFRRTCEQTLDFMAREMQTSQGGFYSSLDADSEGVEGKFYVWTPEEIDAAAQNLRDAALAKAVYQVSSGGNYEEKNVLQRADTEKEVAGAVNMTEDNFRDRMDRIHANLLAYRSQRVRPAADDKVLVFWNAMALQAYAQAARYLKRNDYLKIAQKNARFLLENLYQENRLLRSWRNGTARHNAYLEDYAALIIALIDLYQSDHNLEWFGWAQRLADEMLVHFSDPAGGFFDNRENSHLPVRPKEFQDNATPSGNALAARALLALSDFNDMGEWRRLAERSITTIKDVTVQHPTAFSYWLQAMDYAVGPVHQVALVWPQEQSIPVGLIQVVWDTYRPRLILTASAFPPAEGAPALLHERPPQQNSATAYVCQGFTCQLPVTDPDALENQLESPPQGS